MNEFRPGFRFSPLDGLVLFIGAGLTWLLGSQMVVAGLLVAFVVGHFFLFCNVFRISRRSELIWAAIFVILAVTAIVAGTPPWPVVFGISLVVTIWLIRREMAQPSYHGVGWRRINPSLESWWRDKHAKLADD
jgi:hypothetical protein